MCRIFGNDAESILFEYGRNHENGCGMQVVWKIDEAVKKRTAFDIGVVIVIFDRNGEMIETVDPQLRDYHNAVRYLQDAHCSSGNAQEELEICFDRIPENVDHMAAAAYIYDADYREQSFGMLDEILLTIDTAGSGKTQRWLSMPPEKDALCQGILLGSFTRCGETWRFRSDGRTLRHADRKQAVIAQIMETEGAGRKGIAGEEPQTVRTA
jgi:stress response protein SCP2